MNNLRVVSLLTVLLSGSLPAHAQWLKHPTVGIPRTADGKPDLNAPAPKFPDGTPDLSGSGISHSSPHTVWTSLLTSVQRTSSLPHRGSTINDSGNLARTIREMLGAYHPEPGTSSAV